VASQRQIWGNWLGREECRRPLRCARAREFGTRDIGRRRVINCDERKHQCRRTRPNGRTNAHSWASPSLPVDRAVFEFRSQRSNTAPFLP
jgi:hypothetical protein